MTAVIIRYTPTILRCYDEPPAHNLFASRFAITVATRRR